MRVRLVLLLIHLSLVAGACFLMTVFLWGPQPPDANFGAAALQYIVVAGLALPWSLLWFLHVLPEQSNSVDMLMFVSFALLNVILHGVITLVVTRRRRPESAPDAEPHLTGNASVRR